MKLFRIMLFWLLPTALCSFGAGCSKSQEDSAEWTDRPVPQELLEPEFLRSLSVSVSHNYYRDERPRQPLNFPPDSPEAKLARKFLLSLLSDNEAERVPLDRGEGRLPVRFVYFSSDDSFFYVEAEPNINEMIRVYARTRPGENSTMVRSLRCNKRIIEEINDLWQACAREARRQDAIREAAFQAAAQYLRDVRPDWKDALDLPHEVTDKGDYWLVTFVLPEDQLGGAPVLHVDKRSNKVVKAFHEQ